MRTLFGLIAMCSALTGCSIHPLQDDVTRLELHQIIHKIRCEANDAVHAIMAREGLAQKKPGLAKLDQKIACFKGSKECPFTPVPDETIKYYQDKQKRELDPEKKRLLATKADIVLELKGVTAKLEIARSELQDARETEGPDSPVLKEKIRLAGIALQKYREVYRKYNIYITQAVDFANRVADNKEGEAAVQAKIDEIEKSKLENFGDLIKFNNHQMAYSFRFQIKETNAANLTNLSYRFPIHNGTFTIGVTGGDTKEREGDRNARLSILFKDLDALNCKDAPPDQTGIRTIHYPIRGTIGLHEVIEQYYHLFAQGKFAKAEKDASYTDTITFTTTLNGGVNPSFTISPTTLEQISGTFGFSATRKDIHVVTISLAPLPSEEREKVTKFQLVRDEDDILSLGD